MKYFIGNLKLKNRLLLAPMLEPNDIVFRLLCKKAGCSLSFSGMTSSLTQHDLILEDKPALQIFSNSIKGIKEIIKKYDKKVSLWDFNLGCPSKLSKKLGLQTYILIGTENNIINERKNRILTYINIAIGLVNVVILVWQILKE